MDDKPAAGWYADGHGATRWWDGTAWTAHVAPASTPAASTPAAASTNAATPVPAVAHTSHGAAAGGSGVRHAAVLDRPAPASYGVLSQQVVAPRGSAATGIVLVLAGLVLGGLVLASMAWASEHGGLLWIGGLFVSASLVLRGIAAFSPGSSTARAAVGTHNWINAPRSQTSGSRVVKVLVVAVGAGLALVAIAAAVGPGPSAAPRTMPLTIPSSGAARTYVPPAETQPWYPSGYTLVGRDGAFEPYGYTPAECRPGTACGRVSVVYRRSCPTLQVRVAFFDDPSRVKDRATYRITRIKAAKPRQFVVSTTANVGDYRVTSFRCLR